MIDALVCHREGVALRCPPAETRAASEAAATATASCSRSAW